MKTYNLLRAREDLSLPGHLNQVILLHIKIPLFKMWRDLKDTLKPYKSDWHIKRDLYEQPIHGIKNFIQGSFIALIAPINPLSVYHFHHERADFNYSLSASLKLIGLTYIAAFVTVLRGLSQVATWPLTLLRIPLRLFLFKQQPPPLIEDGKSIKQLLTLRNQSTDLITRSLLRRAVTIKFSKGIARNYPTHTTLKELFAPPKTPTTAKSIEIPRNRP